MLKEESKCNNIIKQYKKCHEGVTKENINKQYLTWSRIPDHLQRILITIDFRSRKANALLNRIKQQDDDDYSIINKIYFYVKDPYEAQYQYLIKKREKNGLEKLKDLKTFIEYSSNQCHQSYSQVIKDIRLNCTHAFIVFT